MDILVLLFGGYVLVVAYVGYMIYSDIKKEKDPTKLTDDEWISGYKAWKAKQSKEDV